MGARGAGWRVVVVVGASSALVRRRRPARPRTRRRAGVGVVVLWVVVVWVVVVWVWVVVVWVLLLPWPCPEPLPWVPLFFCLVAGAPGVGPLLLSGPVVVRPGRWPASSWSRAA